MKFSEFSHLDFEPEFSQGCEYIYHAILKKNNVCFYEIQFPFYQSAYEYGSRSYTFDLDDFRKNPTLSILKPTFSHDETGNEYISGEENIFSGTLEEAKQDERFKDFDIELNVRSERVVTASFKDYEELY